MPYTLNPNRNTSVAVKRVLPTSNKKKKKQGPISAFSSFENQNLPSSTLSMDDSGVVLREGQDPTAVHSRSFSSTVATPSSQGLSSQGLQGPGKRSEDCDPGKRSGGPGKRSGEESVPAKRSGNKGEGRSEGFQTMVCCVCVCVGRRGFRLWYAVTHAHAHASACAHTHFAHRCICAHTHMHSCVRACTKTKIVDEAAGFPTVVYLSPCVNL